MMRGGSELRFTVGTRVNCHIGNDNWHSGRIVRLWYRESHWPNNNDSYAPYQIQLDGKGLIFAPMDTDEFIKMINPPPYMVCADKAKLEFERGNHLAAAEMYYEAVRLAPHVWTARRVANFCNGYCSSLWEAAERDPEIEISNREVKHLDSFVFSKDEPVVFRVAAAIMASSVNRKRRLDIAAGCDYDRIALDCAIR